MRHTGVIVASSLRLAIDWVAFSHRSQPEDRRETPAGVYPIPEMDPTQMVKPSDWLQSNAFDVTDMDQAIYDRINEQYGLDIEMRMK